MIVDDHGDKFGALVGMEYGKNLVRGKVVKGIKEFCLGRLLDTQDRRIGTKRSSQDLYLRCADDALFVVTTRARTQAEVKLSGSDGTMSFFYFLPITSTMWSTDVTNKFLYCNAYVH